MSQITFEFDSPVATATDPAVAFEIGWDFAHFALTPPADHTDRRFAACARAGRPLARASARARSHRHDTRESGCNCA